MWFATNKAPGVRESRKKKQYFGHGSMSVVGASRGEPMAAQRQSAAALRLALSAVLPVVLVVYAVWGVSRSGPAELYVVWNSGQTYGAPYGQQQQQQYVQPASGVGQTSPYFNAVNTAELSVNVNPYDAAALQYSGSGPPQNQMQTLHALASAKRLYHQMQAPAAGNQYASYWSKKANNPTAALQSLQSKMGAGSQASKQIAQASLAIQQVMQQSKADHRIAKAATRGGQRDTGNSWKSLLSRESGPQKTAMASDWLATAVATSKGKHSKTKYARAQLEAALSQVCVRASHVRLHARKPPRTRLLARCLRACEATRLWTRLP